MEQCSYIAGSRIGRSGHLLTGSLDSLAFAQPTRVGDTMYITAQVHFTALLPPHFVRCEERLFASGLCLYQTCRKRMRAACLKKEPFACVSKSPLHCARMPAQGYRYTFRQVDISHSLVTPLSAGSECGCVCGVRGKRLAAVPVSDQSPERSSGRGR